MTPAELKLECLKQAVIVTGRRVENDVDAIVEISTQFYNHIAESSDLDTKGSGLTARVDKRATKK